MPNTSGKAYGLTTLCPIINGSNDQQSFSSLTREYLQEMPTLAASPMAKVPNTYLCRFFILNDAIFEAYPHKLDHLKSSYLVFTSNFHGDRDAYLRGMWNAISGDIKKIWQYCVGFNANDPNTFVEYIHKCQVKTTYYFNGSTDDSLEEQLKSLYLKQEFSDFVYAHQGDTDIDLLLAFKEFVSRTKPQILSFPTWKAGAETLDDLVYHGPSPEYTQADNQLVTS